MFGLLVADPRQMWGVKCEGCGLGVGFDMESGLREEVAWLTVPLEGTTYLDFLIGCRNLNPAGPMHAGGLVFLLLLLLAIFLLPSAAKLLEDENVLLLWLRSSFSPRAR